MIDRKGVVRGKRVVVRVYVGCVVATELTKETVRAFAALSERLVVQSTG